MRRDDIQGLRALAVLAVVAFHSGLPLPGGFVGVDLFFVISGYVITNMLRREWEANGRIAFGRFYARRFKRLAPALSLVIAVTVVGASLTLSPFGPQENIVKTAVGALCFVANWVIATTTGGYFDLPADSNALLHTWSLSVEEQFYLVFPAVLAVSWASRRRLAAPVVVAVLTAASFVVMLRGGGSWSVGFYGPLARAWEFGAGALLALATAKAGIRSPRAAFAASAAGCVLLYLSLSAIVVGMPYPSMWTVLPVAAAALLLVGGTNTANVVTRILSTRPLTTIGDWSYSVYLWHWPLLVCAAALWPSTAHVRIYAAAASFVPAVLSYRFVETPLRTMSVQPIRRLAVVAVSVLALPLVVDSAMASGVRGVWSPFRAAGLPANYAQSVGEAPFFRRLSAAFPPCADARLRAVAARYDGRPRCFQSQPGAPPTVAVIGDSHAEHLFFGLAQALPRQTVEYDSVYDGTGPGDGSLPAIVRAVAAEPSVETIVFNGFWQRRGLQQASQLVPALRELSAPGRRVFLTDDVAFFSFNAAQCKYRRSVLAPKVCSESSRRFWQAYRIYDAALRAAAAAVPGVAIIDTAHLFCDAQTCSMVQGGRLLYRDSHHLNIAGSRFVAAHIVRDPAFARATVDPRRPLH